MYEETRDLSLGSDYSVGSSDPNTPNLSQAGQLDQNVVNKLVWGSTPQDYVEWFDRLWHKGDPSGWGPEVFTPNAIMLDAAGTSVGAAAAANDFLLLFKYFPELRGEVVSWSRNNTEIFINWRFVVTKKRLCPVIDKFSFNGGLVSYRQAYFDTVMLLGYLSENFGSGRVVDYFIDRFMNELGGSGVLFIPGLLWTFIQGLFYWSIVPLDPPTGLTPVPGNRLISLTWDKVPGTIYYRVSRSTAIGGTYSWIGHTTETFFVDQNLKGGTTYYYVVSAQNTVPPETPQTPTTKQSQPTIKQKI